MIVIPIIIGLQGFIGYGVTVAVVMTVPTTIFCFVATPYLQKLDNIRLIAYRVIVNVIAILQLVFKAKFPKEEGLIFVEPFLVFALLFLILIANTSFSVWRSYQELKREGAIDRKMLEEQRK